MSARAVSLLLTAVLAVYFVLLGGRAVALFRDGAPVAVALGVGVILLPLVGAWVAWSTLRFGLRTQVLGRQLQEEGGLPDTSDLPRLPSGRVDRTAADAFFEEIQAEAEAAPDDWRSWYRLAVAYDTAGDRTRARQSMRKALELAES
ncbi:tetratricopeptide repeat protein [Actinokineospora auranticolor]|uniref:Tetratricopeptide repeat protein n=1 Tax=Actinokineospora auranticolor TaxID=155976 RepID=A0A2S6GQH5_9PSEU|nr:tetratricopeptide repeat protein [Actinokineospora auranticolor]PPK67449.1 tetratricopeptide repeat protein [Actinokineospora auranticolor]